MLASLAVVIAAASACSSSSSTASGPAVVVGGSTSPGGFRGDQVSPSVPLTAASAAVRFSSSLGGTTTLGDLQSGHLMLLYFGYTHCPDVCPTTMADLGQALRQLPASEQKSTEVVFVTADPDRDSPAVMKTWLSNFDTGLPHPFIGLTAKVGAIDAVAKSVGVPLDPPVEEKNGSVSVEHGAQTLAFRNDKAGLVWLAGTPPADYAHDVTKLMSGSGS